MKAGTALAAIAVAAALAIVSPAAATAAPRYASPTGAGTACTQGAPCDFKEAVEGAADGDEVIVQPGVHAPAGSVLLDTAADVHGVGGQPRPRIVSAASPALDVDDPGARLHWLDVSHSGAGDALLLDGGAASTLAVESSGAGFACHVRGATLQDSTCWAKNGGIAAGAAVAGEYQRTDLFNVTAFAAGAGSRGVRVAASSGFADLHALNVIARGGVDLEVQSDPTGSVAVANMDFSNYATRSLIGPEAHASEPGIAANQTAAPVFADAAQGDFHQDASSPTVDRGTLAGFAVGDSDLDGEARVQGFGIDIGADELFVGPLPPDSNPPDTRILRKPKARTTRRLASFKFGTTEPVNAVFMCSVDGKAFRSCKSPLKLRVKRRRHTFAVYSIDEAGNVDPSPDAYSWKVRRKPKG